MMKNIFLSSFFEKVVATIKESDYLLYVLIGCAAVLVILVICLIVVASKKNKHNENEDERLIKETLKEENLQEEQEKVVEEENKEEKPQLESEIVEEKPKKKRTKKVVDKVEETNEELQPEEANVVEEQPQDKPARKKTKKAELETPVEPTEEKNEENEEVEMAKVEEKAVKKERVVTGKYEVYFDGSKYFYTLKASNGEILIKSEMYASKSAVLDAIDRIKRNVTEGSVEIREDKHGLFQFALVAKNHRTLVLSANYSTEKRAESASQSFKRFAEISPVVEIAEQVESAREAIDVSSASDKKGGKIGVAAEDGGYYYYLKASNNEVLVHSDIYKSQKSAEEALLRFKEAVKTGEFFVEKDKRGNFQFKLYAANGRLVCVGEVYASKPMAISSAISVCSFVELAVKAE